jgi:hypothetical protein
MDREAEWWLDLRMRHVFITAALSSTFLVACGGDVCSKLYDKMKECAPEGKSDFPDKAKFVEECKAQQQKEKDAGTYDEEEEKAIAACLDKKCDEMQKCMSEESEKRYIAKQVKEIKAASESGDVAKMKDACQYVNEEVEELVAACKEVMPKVFEATVAEVTKQRDEGKHDFGTCHDLERFAKMAGGDAEAKAQSLCAESQAAEMVGKALTESKEKVDAKDADIPYPCKAALEDLAKIDSEWAKAKQKEVINACYVDLGKVIMEVKVPDMKYVCDFRVKEVYQAVKDHGLDDADLLEWVEKAKPLCEKD